MLLIGLTGGIGSGKSTVANYFAELGINIIDADIIARDVVQPNTDAIKKIAEHFGKDVMLADGNLNRSLLREKIFNSPIEKIWLEKLLHPLIITEIRKQAAASQSIYTIAVIPLLLEANLTDLVDRVLIVDISEEKQIENTMFRDQCSRASVIKIMSTQVTRHFRLEHADDVIRNDRDLIALKEQVYHLHKKYLALNAKD